MSESPPVDNLKHIQLVVCPIHSKAEEEACIPLVHNLQEKSSCSQFKEKNTSGKNDQQKTSICKKPFVHNLQKNYLFYTICKISLLYSICKKNTSFEQFAKEGLLYIFCKRLPLVHNLWFSRDST